MNPCPSWCNLPQNSADHEWCHLRTIVDDETMTVELTWSDDDPEPGVDLSLPPGELSWSDAAKLSAALITADQLLGGGAATHTDPCPSWCGGAHEPIDGHWCAVIEDGIVRVDIGEGNYGQPLIGVSVLQPRDLTPTEARRFAAAIVQAADLAEEVQS